MGHYRRNSKIIAKCTSDQKVYESCLVSLVTREMHRNHSRENGSYQRQQVLNKSDRNTLVNLSRSKLAQALKNGENPLKTNRSTMVYNQRKSGQYEVTPALLCSLWVTFENKLLINCQKMQRIEHVVQCPETYGQPRLALNS